MDPIKFTRQKGQTLQAILAKAGQTDAFVATLDNHYEDLSTVVGDNKRHVLVGLSFDTPESTKVYEASLRFLVVLALRRIRPDYSLIVTYGISRSIFLRFKDRKTGKEIICDGALKKALLDEMANLVSQNLPIRCLTVSKAEALAIYEKEGLLDHADSLSYRPENTVHLYECDGYLDYPYSHMVASTGYLRKYRILSFTPGLLLSYPRSEENGLIPPLETDSAFGKALRNNLNWAQSAGLYTIGDINRMVKSHGPYVLAEISEDYFNGQMARLSTLLKAKAGQVRFITVSGPSSSGKTTFAKKLLCSLMALGFRPVRVSLDDYYLPRDCIPKGPDGQPDLESINALDLARFQADMVALANGKTVSLPVYDFQTKSVKSTREATLGKGQPVIVEGIHGLNPKLWSPIDRSQRFGIYISPQCQVAIDNLNPMSLTDARLIRRIVRDSLFRDTPADETLGMWAKVRNSEFRHIYPYQSNADFVFNSYFAYEVCVLKKHALPLLKAVSKDSPQYPVASRLIKFIKYFPTVPDAAVPVNSLLREFIGQGAFGE